MKPFMGKELEKVLKSSREGIAAVILDNISEQVLLISRDFRILWANKAIMDLMYLKESKIIGDFCYKITHNVNEPCQPPHHICPVEMLLKTGKPRREIHAHFDKDGNEYYAEVTAFPIKDEKGEVTQFIHITGDVTEQVKAQRPLKEAKDYTDNIIKSMIDTLIVVDAEAKMQTVNPATCELLGYTEEELIGKPVSIISAEVRRVFQFFREPERAQAPGPQDTIRNRELTYKTKDGQLIPMSFNASVLTDKAGNLTGVVAGAKDITELKLKEAEIRSGRKFSENIIATIPDSLLVLDKDLRIKKANRTFYETFMPHGDTKDNENPPLPPFGKGGLGGFASETFQSDIDPEKVIGTSIAEILQDKDGKLSTELAKLFGTEDMLENFELCYQSGKLGERVFNITARGIIFAEEEEEEEDQQLVVLQDITEQNRAEQALRESENKYKALTESSLTGIFIHQDGRYVFVNDRFGEIHGYKNEELLGKDHLTLVHPDEREAVEEKREKRLKGQAVGHRYEVKRLRKDGDAIWCEMMAARIQYRGRPAIMGNVIDISDRKRAEDALRESEERYRSLVESTEDSIYLVDRDCNYLFMNGKHLSRFGLPPGKVIGKAYRELHSKEETKGFLRKMNKVFETGKSLSYEYRSQRDGRYFLRTLSPVKNPDGRIVAITVVSKDITELKQTEEDLRAAYAELKETQKILIQSEKMAALGRFSSGIAHQVRNPLAIILSSIELLERRFSNSDGETSIVINSIKDATFRADYIIQGLLRFSRPSKFEVKRLNVCDLVNDILPLFKQRVGLMNIRINTHFAQKGLYIGADKNQIEQALFNLFTNAVDAMPKGGEIDIKIYKTMPSRSYSQKPSCVIEIKDTGEGISKEELSKIFEPFFTTKAGRKGTGLGLPIAKRIVEDYNGIITIDSELEEGTEVKIIFPLA